MSSTNQSTTGQRDEELWTIARKRSGFRRHLFAYIVVNSFLWLLWAIMGNGSGDGIPWPAWSSIGWGIGLAFNYADAYLFHSTNSVENEYQKLVKEKNKL